MDLCGTDQAASAIQFRCPLPFHFPCATVEWPHAAYNTKRAKMTANIRTIKRYANRKLYDTEESCYITLEQIAEMIREGQEIVVIDNSTKEDLTSVTLAQVIFEAEKQNRSFLPLSALRKIIQSGGESFHDFVNQIQHSAGRMGRVFRRDDADVEGDVPEALQNPGEADIVQAVDDSMPKVSGRSDPARRSVLEFFEGLQSSVEDWQKRMDANVHNALENMLPIGTLQKEIALLRQRIAGLEGRLRGRDALDTDEMEKQEAFQVDAPAVTKQKKSTTSPKKR